MDIWIPIVTAILTNAIIYRDICVCEYMYSSLNGKEELERTFLAIIEIDLYSQHYNYT